MKKPVLYLVEDNPMYRYAMTERLAGEGYALFVFDSVAECLESTAPMPDLLLLDYELENGRTGMEVLEHFQRQTARPIPTVILSGQRNVGRALGAMKAGIYDYLVKDDLDMQQLVDTIDKMRERNSLRATENELRQAVRKRKIMAFSGAFFLLALFLTLLFTAI